jgi:hypothetical protein
VFISVRTSLYVHYVLIIYYMFQAPITVVARSKARTIFAPSNAGIMGSSPTRGMDVCVRLLCVCVVLCVGSGPARADLLSKVSYRQYIRSRNLKSVQGPK